MGIFDQHPSIFTTYRARIIFRDRLMGGIPMEPRMIEGWLRGKAGISDQEEIRRAMLTTLLELGADVTPGMSYDELVLASEKVAAIKNTVGFKRDHDGLYIESRTIKAMLKECTNILFAGKDRWGVTRKGPKAFLAERVFPNPDRIHLGRDEPDGIHLFVGHQTGPKGPQSNLTYHEYVERPEIAFTLLVTHDDIPHDAWPAIWQQAQENGLGALRSQGFGRFDIEEWEPVTAGVPDAFLAAV